jgi:hypothetical protein
MTYQKIATPQIFTKYYTTLFQNSCSALYHREWICFHQLLAATRRRIKITKPLTLRAPFNQPRNFERAHPFQTTKQF